MKRPTLAHALLIALVTLGAMTFAARCQNQSAPTAPADAEAKAAAAKTKSEQYLNSNGCDWKQLYKTYTDAAKAKKAEAAKQPAP